MAKKKAVNKRAPRAAKVESTILPMKMVVGEVEIAFDKAFTPSPEENPFDSANKLRDFILANPAHALSYAQSLSERYQIVMMLLKNHGHRGKVA